MTGGYVFAVRLRGRLGPAARQAFAHLDVADDDGPATTVLGGIVDQGGLHAVLDRVQSLGLEVVEITSDPAGRD